MLTHSHFDHVGGPAESIGQTLDGARAFSQDPSLPAAMQRGGVEGHPQVWIVEEAEAASY